MSAGRSAALRMLVRPTRADLSGAVLPLVAFALITAVAISVMTIAQGFWRTPDPEGFGQYRILAVAMLAVLVVPASTLGGSAARLSARRREDRLATLRLMGASPSWVRGVALVEAGWIAAVGAMLGALSSLLLVPALSLVPVSGQPLGMAEAWPSPLSAVILALGIVLIALASAAAGFIRPRRENVGRVIDAAVNRGEIAGEGIDAEYICDLLFGPLLSRVLLPTDLALNDTIARKTVSSVMHEFETGRD